LKYIVDFKKFRRQNNFTQVQAAEYFGCDQSFISQIENGRTPDLMIMKHCARNPVMPVYRGEQVLSKKDLANYSSSFGVFFALFFLANTFNIASNVSDDSAFFLFI